MIFLFHPHPFIPAPKGGEIGFLDVRDGSAVPDIQKSFFLPFPKLGEGAGDGGVRPRTGKGRFLLDLTLMRW